MIEDQEGLFANFELEGEVKSINIAGSKGKGCQIDVYAKLRKQSKGKKKEYLTFMAEIKTLKPKYP